MNEQNYYIETIQEATNIICDNLKQACQEVVDSDATTGNDAFPENSILAQAASKIPWLKESNYAIRNMVANAAIRAIAKL